MIPTDILSTDSVVVVVYLPDFCVEIFCTVTTSLLRSDPTLDMADYTVAVADRAGSPNKVRIGQLSGKLQSLQDELEHEKQVRRNLIVKSCSSVAERFLSFRLAAMPWSSSSRCLMTSSSGHRSPRRRSSR